MDFNSQIAWLAGFVDGDGSINAQIVFRSDYKLRYQVRVTLTLFQSTERHHILLYIQKLLRSGVVRKRNDGMSEFCITGAKQLKEALLLLLPHLKLKKRQATLVLQIIDKLPYTKDVSILLEACAIADKVGLLTDGKRRTQKYDQVVETLRSLGLYPLKPLDQKQISALLVIPLYWAVSPIIQIPVETLRCDRHFYWLT